MEKDNKLSVTQLNSYIKGVFDDELILKNIAVFGEVYECSNSGGNLYFTLKDEDSILRCVRFGGGFIPSIGDTVTVVGSVDYYVKGNRVSFRAKNIEPFGEGILKRKIIELHDKLAAEGLFDNHPPIPNFIHKVAIVTSETGAVIHDFISVIRKKHAYIDVVLYHVKVQGNGAETEIADAVSEAGAGDCDIIVVARGGGSNTDLDVFNAEIVTRAVANSPKPVISAIGHQVDYTLCDYAASIRAGTPSIAGENVCRVNEAFIKNFYDVLSRMNNAIAIIYAKNRSRICYVAKKLTDDAFSTLYSGKLRLNNAIKLLFSLAEQKTQNAHHAITDLINRCWAEVEKKYTKNENDLALLAGRLDAVSPLGIISRGYAKVCHDGRCVSSACDISIGEDIQTVFADGIINSKVTSTELKES